VGAAAVYLAFRAVGARALSGVVKGVGIAFIIVVLIAISPIGNRIAEVLPIMGRTADFSITYRERLAGRGWELVLAHPLFGDQFPWPRLEDLRQGEGIIDIVNSYLGVALNYGLVGLFVFMSFIILATVQVFRRAKKLADSDSDLALYGASLAACIVGILVMIEGNSFNLGAEKMFYVLAGLATAYARLATPPQHWPGRSGPGGVPLR
jgi:O-antigen ligase